MPPSSVNESLYEPLVSEGDAFGDCAAGSIGIKKRQRPYRIPRPSGHYVAGETSVCKSFAQQTWPLLVTPILLFATIVAFMITAPGTATTGNTIDDRVYKNPMLLVSAVPLQIIFFSWIFCVVLHVWESTPSLDFVRIFPALECAKGGRLARYVFGAAVVFTGCMACYLGIYWRPNTTGSGAYTVPFANVIGQLLVLLLPLLFLCAPWGSTWPARRAFLRTLGECLVCVTGYPILTSGRVEFHHVFVTDVLTSSIVILWEITYSVCRFSHHSWNTTVYHQDTTGDKPDVCFGSNSEIFAWLQPAVATIPYWLRFVQCVRLYVIARRSGSRGWARNSHLANAGKYASSIAGVFGVAAVKILHFYDGQPSDYFGNWRVIVLLVLIVRTLYSLAWDLLMDWALLRGGFSSWQGLRPIIAFAPVAYYTAMVSDAVLRCLWVATLQSAWCYSGCSYIFGFAEIVRRGQWMVYRVEHQFLATNGYMNAESVSAWGVDHVLGRDGFVMVAAHQPAEGGAAGGGGGGGGRRRGGLVAAQTAAQNSTETAGLTGSGSDGGILLLDYASAELNPQLHRNQQ